MTSDQQRPKIVPRPNTATFFVTCLVDQFRPQVGDAVVEVLKEEGVRVNVPPEQTCCGQPAFNSGFREEAREVATRFLDIFDDPNDDLNPIVTPSGSCAAMVRNYYPVLFRGDPIQLERAKRVGDRLWEFSEFLVDGLGQPANRKTATGTTEPSGDAPDMSSAETPLAAEENSSVPTTYHRCCHALRELGIDRQPTALLGAIENLRLEPLERSEVCCGFGGAFSVKMPDISTAMLDEKLDYIEATGASRLIAGDTGCIMQMEGGLRRRGSSIEVLHIAELLAASSGKAADPTESAPASGYSPATESVATTSQESPEPRESSSDRQEPAR